MTIYTITAALREQLQHALQTQCGGRCNAEYNPCEAQELDTMLHSLTPNSGEPVNEQAAFEEWFIQRKRESFPKDYDESRFSNWAENYRHDSLRGWNARAAITHPAPSTKPADDRIADAGKTNGWQPIETAPKDRTMFVVHGFNVEVRKDYYCDTGPYCVWSSGDGFERWPHPFKPTHCMPLPAAPQQGETE